LVDLTFYKNYGPYNLEEIVDGIDCVIKGDSKKVIKNISTLREGTNSDLSFFSNKKYFKDFEMSESGVIVVEKKYSTFGNRNYIISNNPHYAFAQIANKFYPDSIYPNFYFSDNDVLKTFDKKEINVSKNCFVHKTAKLGNNITIGVNSVIGPNVSIGNNCIIGDNVSLYFSHVMSNVKIFPGAKIGTDGFGFAINKNSYLKIPQIGRVLIYDNVEIGSNCTIDRGSCGDTIIKKNCMIDNLVHIAHNVEIGENSVIAGMTGIAGSTVIGKNVFMGGQVGVNGHIKIGDNVKIAAKSGVMSDIDDNQSYGGYPAQPIKSWHKNTIFLRKNASNK
tara:strand:+ start:263 stop:1264 length:1002 start_codon:yes stop_codon:yes gene_type:complete